MTVMTDTKNKVSARSSGTAEAAGQADAGSPIRRAAAGASARKDKGTSWRLWAAGSAALLIIGGLMWVILGRAHAANDLPVLTYAVTTQSFPVNIPLSGELKAVKNVEVRCQVEGQTTIISIVPEGKQVKAGDELVTLASDAIKDKVEDAKIRVENAKAALVNSRESVTIQEKQNESDIAQAETNAKLATLGYEQFDKGDSRVEIETRKTTLENATTDLQRKTDDLAKVKELAASGFVSNNDVLDAQIAFRDAQNKLQTAKMDLDVWNKYAEPKTRQTLERARDGARGDLERTIIKAKAAMLLKQADVWAKDATQVVESRRLGALEVQLAACIIRAPQDGLVVYQSSVQQGWGGNGPIEEGAQVRQNQTIIQLPDLAHLLVEVRLPEQLLDRVTPELPAVVTIDAMPGQVLSGKVNKISPLADGTNRWLNPNLKEYLTEIVLDGTMPAGLKPSMTAKAEINVANLKDVVAVPVQAVFVGGGQSYVYVGTAEAYERRPIVTGLSSSDKIEIKDGLRSGETVLLSRPKGAMADAAEGGKGDRRGKGKKDASTQPVGKSNAGGAA